MMSHRVEPGKAHRRLPTEGKGSRSRSGSAQGWTSSIATEGLRPRFPPTMTSGSWRRQGAPEPAVEISEREIPLIANLLEGAEQDQVVRRTADTGYLRQPSIGRHRKVA